MSQPRKIPASRIAPAPIRQRPWRTLAVACVLSACTLIAVPSLAAQTPKPSPAIAQRPPTFHAPVSLASKPSIAAQVTFKNGQLTILARNSDLLQILHSVSAQTGMKVQGSPGNHRIFGTYGPGKPNEVLSSLLSGFNFNYLLLGKEHNGAPQKLILAGLAPTTPAPPQPTQSIQPAPPPPARKRPTYPFPKQPRPPRRPSAEQRQPTNTPHGIRTPQQILKEMEAMRAKQHQQQQQPQR